MTLFGVAVLFVAQEAHFLAAVQVIVYAGAIVVLFLFVIMLLGVDKSEDVRRPSAPQGPAPGRHRGSALAVMRAGPRAGSLGSWVTGRPQRGRRRSATAAENVERLARSLFTRYLLAFEITSVLLVIAVVGAVVLARRPDGRHAPTSARAPVSGSAETRRA